MPRLKPVVFRLATLFEMVSICVEWARIPIEEM